MLSRPQGKNSGLSRPQGFGPAALIIWPRLTYRWSPVEETRHCVSLSVRLSVCHNRKRVVHISFIIAAWPGRPETNIAIFRDSLANGAGPSYHGSLRKSLVIYRMAKLPLTFKLQRHFGVTLCWQHFKFGPSKDVLLYYESQLAHFAPHIIVSLKSDWFSSDLSRIAQIVIFSGLTYHPHRTMLTHVCDVFLRYGRPME